MSLYETKRYFGFFSVIVDAYGIIVLNILKIYLLHLSILGTVKSSKFYWIEIEYDTLSVEMYSQPSSKTENYIRTTVTKLSLIR